LRTATLILLTWVAILPTRTAMADRLTFNRTDALSSIALSGNYLTTIVGAEVDGLAMPQVSYLLPLTDGVAPESITFSVTERASLGFTDKPSRDSALTTSDDRYYDSTLRTDQLVPTFGRNAVEITGGMQTDGIRYAEVTVFPVTVDESGEIWLNEEISLAVGDRELDASALLPRADVVSSSQPNRTAREHSAQSTVYDYLIVTSVSLLDALRPLAEYRIETGRRVRFALIEDILASQTGRDDAERLRNYLRAFYDEGGLYVLLGGDETVIPIRYAYHYNAYSTPDLGEQQVCDLYFADLTGDWDTDNDGVWGERYQDNADLSPELRLGRLPVNTPEAAAACVANIIRYESDPGAGDREDLTRAFFFSSDQMRDDGTAGQHAAIAGAYPNWIKIDTVNGVEVSRGDDPAPYNLPGDRLPPVFADGFGIVNIIAHGRSDGFVVRSSDYNQWPKSYLFSSDQGVGHGDCASLFTPEKPSFYYSLACDNGGFDMDQPPFNATTPNLVQNFFGCEGGAVGFVAYSRWGWISSSHLLQRSFFASLFAYPGQPAVEAMYASKAEYYYHRDLVYGQNYFGDPALRVYTETPRRLTVAASGTDGQLVVTVTSGESPVLGCNVIVSKTGELLGTFTTDSHGRVYPQLDIDTTSVYRIAAVMPNAPVTRMSYSPGSVTAVEDDPGGSLLPGTFALHQNYPNPFNPTTVIAFELPRTTQVRIDVMNVIGQTVATLLDEAMPAGQHEVEWNGKNERGHEAASGVYFYRLTADERSMVRKMVLLR